MAPSLLRYILGRHDTQLVEGSLPMKHCVQLVSGSLPWGHWVLVGTVSALETMVVSVLEAVIDSVLEAVAVDAVTISVLEEIQVIRLLGCRVCTRQLF